MVVQRAWPTFLINSLTLLVFLAAPLHAADAVLTGEATGGKPDSGPLRASLDTHFAKSLAEDTDLEWHLVAGVGYRLSKNVSVNGLTEFKNTFGKYKQRGENWAFEDSLLYFQLGDALTWQELDLQFAPSIGIVLPTSRTSQDAGMKLGYFTDIQLQKKWSSGSALYLNRLYVFDHRYKTSSPFADDSSANVYLTDVNEIRVTQGVLPKVEILSKVGLLLNSSYQKAFFSAAYFELEPHYKFNEQLLAYVAGRFKNRVVSDYSFLDDDNMRIEFGLQWSL